MRQGEAGEWGNGGAGGGLEGFSWGAEQWTLDPMVLAISTNQMLA